MVDALYSRGLAANNSRGQQTKAIADFSRIIEMKGVSTEKLAEALFGRGLAYTILGKTQETIADYSAVIALPNAPVHEVTQSLIFRGMAYGALGRDADAMADYKAVLRFPGADASATAEARKLIEELKAE